MCLGGLPNSTDACRDFPVRLLAVSPFLASRAVSADTERNFFCAFGAVAVVACPLVLPLVGGVTDGARSSKISGNSD